MSIAVRKVVTPTMEHLPRLRLVGGALPETDALVADNVRLVYAAAHRVLPRGLCPGDHDDAVQAGLIGLYHAARQFDPARGFAFSTYATVAIVRRIKAAHRRRAVERARHITLSDVNASSSRTAQADHRDVPASLDAAREVDRLAGREREIMLRLSGWDGLPAETLASIAGRWGVSVERARQVQASALNRLRRRLGVCGEGERPKRGARRRRRGRAGHARR